MALQRYLQLCGKLSDSATALFKETGLMRKLMGVPNAVDYERVKLIGADHACAEWLLRCGAHIRWKGHGQYVTDFSALPSVVCHEADKLNKEYLLEEVYALEAVIMHFGFHHFDGCKGVKRMALLKCDEVTDTCLAVMVTHGLHESLEHLEITHTKYVSLAGAKELAVFNKLKTLRLSHLPAFGRNAEDFLKSNLPNCNIICEHLGEIASEE